MIQLKIQILIFGDALLDEKLYEFISVYEILYKTSTVPKPLLIRFNEIDEFITVRGGEFRNLVLFDYEFFDKICDKIKCLISEKNGITDSINHNFREITTDSYKSKKKKKY